ncbi:hypothetical protein LUZ61_001925 [Rhynchospora tenuis]|uniref:TF-B3 domain-containing protein n=1 Tax=Rhynchospora tenuis TaxID=198213 RepID=A0AAD5ZI07_9POAL|nr:hypothetical protein LUZ61_001925 [Rhynchospora tenuis]
MATRGGSLPRRPHFFKFLFPSLSANLRIPSKFHRHLPSELQKAAALLCPHHSVWYVEVCQIGPDIFFERGWPEFMKAHDMHIGYFLLFQYNGNMNFEVKVFDTTCCLKDYSLKHCTSAVPPYIEIEDSSTNENPAVSDTSDGCNLSNSSDKEKEVLEKDQRVVHMDVQSKKPLKTAQNATGFAQFEKILTPSMVQMDIIHVPRKFCVKNDLVSNRTIFLKRKLEGDGKVDPREWRVGFFFGPKECRIRNGWRTFSKENSLRIGDRCIFKLVSKDVLLVEAHGLANSIGGKTKYIDGKSQGIANDQEKRPCPQVDSVLREKNLGRSCKRTAFIDIQDLSESNDKKISKNSDEIPSNFLRKKRKLSNSIVKEEEEEEKEVQGKNKPNFICFDQFEKILTRSMVESTYINIPKAFCVKNDLVTNRIIFLQRKLEEEGNAVPGKWPVELNCNPPHYRFRKGWKRFSKENRLKIGVRCIFQLVSKDTFIVRKVPSENISIKTDDKLSHQRSSSPAIASTKKQIALERKDPKNNLQCECIIKGYNLKSFISLRKTFCEANGLIRKQIIFLKRSIDGKVWSVGYHPRENEGRLSLGWIDFARENKLEVGDKCTFQLVSESTLHANIARKCRKRDAVRNDFRIERQNIVDESEVSVTVRQFHLTYNYLSIPISFCLRNKLTTKREMVLKASEGKVWYVNFFLNGYKEGRLSRADEWGKFARENELKEGDKLFLKVVSKETMVFRVVKDRVFV